MRVNDFYLANYSVDVQNHPVVFGHTEAYQIALLQEMKMNLERIQLDAIRAQHRVQLAWIPILEILDPREHFLASYSPFDRTIELEDGSFWRVNLFDMYKVSAWAADDVLSISPNSWAVPGEYLITNNMTGETIQVDLVVGPVAFGPNTHWIVGIDRWLGRVYLENGTFWDVRGLDQHYLSNWSIHDTIILGDGGNEWIGNHDSILINVNMNQYAYANRGA